MYKKLLSTFFLFLLMIPTSIQVLHELENHEHTICTSIGEHHIHSLNSDCSDIHKQLIVFSTNITFNYNVIPTNYYTTICIDKPQKIKEIYQSTKTTRGPPNFTV